MGKANENLNVREYSRPSDNARTTIYSENTDSKTGNPVGPDNGHIVVKESGVSYARTMDGTVIYDEDKDK